MTTMVDKVRLFDESGLFDEDWYVDRYPDVRLSSLSPVEHYVRIGQHIGRKPSRHPDDRVAERFIAACHVPDLAGIQVDDQTRHRIAALRLFDADWYKQRHAPELSHDEDALADYLRRSATNPLIDPCAIFSTARYVEKNPDVTGMAPLIHACSHGFEEGRSILDATKVDEFLSATHHSRCSAIGDLLDRSRRVEILFWREGNFFFQEIAEYLETYLRTAGYDVGCGFDVPISGPSDAIFVVVAPHEFCALGPGKVWSEARLAQAVYLNTEQWHTGWFSLTYRFLVLSGKAIDINPASASGLQNLGIRTAFLPIQPIERSPFSVGTAPISAKFGEARYIPALTYPDTLDERPYDVFFIGASNSRREAAIASLAPVLAAHETFIHCPRFSGPVRQGDPDMMSTSDLVQIARNAKILLNIHQGESRYFEWHRLFLFGIMEGCVVLTEPCIPNPYVKADRHFLECEVAAMPERLRWLLGTVDGRSEMRRVRAHCDRLRHEVAGWGPVSS